MKITSKRIWQEALLKCRYGFTKPKTRPSMADVKQNTSLTGLQNIGSYTNIISNDTGSFRYFFK